MDRIVIIGNSEAGKTTLAKMYASNGSRSHLDLDTLAWLNTIPPERMPLSESAVKIQHFLDKNIKWVIEGCYSDLLNIVISDTTKLIFLNPGVDTCIKNCKNRPWEPHKFSSLEEQNKNLDMLLNWVRDYPTQYDEFSLQSHEKIFSDFTGEKQELTSNQ